MPLIATNWPAFTEIMKIEQRLSDNSLRLWALVLELIEHLFPKEEQWAELKYLY